MTKGEAYRLFLRYLGEATVNGSAKDDPDLRDLFDQLFPQAVGSVGASFPPRETQLLTECDWEAPDDLIEVTRALDDHFLPVAFLRLGERQYHFSAPCRVEYTRMPHAISATAPDSTEIDLGRASLLVPIQTAVNAALSQEAYAYKVSYLTSSYNALADALGEADGITFRRVYVI